MKEKVIIILLLFGSVNLVQAQDSITLVGKLKITNLPIHDVWGYRDSATNKKYALLCASTAGLRVIDLSDITKPTLAGSISGGGVRAIDVKSWKNYAYVVGESPLVSGKVIDLTDPTNPTKVGTFPAGHNITISDSGYLYLSSPGVRIFDLNNDPTKPALVYSLNSCFGHDISIVGTRLYDFSDNCGTRIFDISQPDTLVSLGTVPASGIFHHSGWPSEDGNYLFICDELAKPTENDITVWDISNLSNIVMVDSFNDPNAYVHNLYVIGNYAYVSYYRAGFRVFDVSDPTKIAMVAEYDTDSTLSGPGYGGNYGLYRFEPENYILASDEENGLYIFNFSQLYLSVDENKIEHEPLNIYPNPGNNYVVIEKDKVSFNSNSTIKIYNAVGVLIKDVKVDNTITISTGDFEQGIYYAVYNLGNTTFRKPFIIIH